MADLKKDLHGNNMFNIERGIIIQAGPEGFTFDVIEMPLTEVYGVLAMIQKQITDGLTTKQPVNELKEDVV